jgi:cysteine desulfurase
VTNIPPDSSGRVSADQVIATLRDDTLLVSLMHVNNETGMIQPVDEVAERIGDRETILHVDAAQGFAKDLLRLRHQRIDLLSVSGHKFGGPMGIGALIMRKRKYRAPELSPLGFGGGQERGLRPGTIPVMLVAAMGAAAQAKLDGHSRWLRACTVFRDTLLVDLSTLPVAFDLNMDLQHALPNCVNLSLRDKMGSWLSSESVLLSLKDLIAASNGSACTSAGIEPSHVLSAQQYPAARARAAIRLSWCDDTPRPNWAEVGAALRRLL